MRDEKGFLARAAWRLAVSKVRPKRFVPQPESREIVSEKGSPEKACLVSERTRTIHRLIDTLPEKLRRPLALSSIEEMTTPEIAAVIASAAAIALSACLILWMTPRTLVQPLPTSKTSATVGAPRIRLIPQAQSAAVGAIVEKPRRIRAKTAEPRLAQFPVPSGLGRRASVSAFGPGARESSTSHVSRPSSDTN